MKKILLVILVLLSCGAAAFAQVDRREVRSGNRAFRKGDWAKSEIDYKKAMLKDSASVAAQYNLANALYRQENYTEAEKYAKAALDSLSRSPKGSDAYFNAGDIYLQQRRWSEAVEAFKSSLRLRPDDMDAKSNLAYAQKMLEKQQQDQQDQNQDGQNDQNQNQNQNQDQDKQDQNQNQDQDNQDDQKDQNKDENDDRQDRNQDQNRQDDGQAPQQKITPEAAEQMLQAIQAKEDETQEKVKKEKAAAVKSRRKEKNW